MLHQHLLNKSLNIEVAVFFKVISDCCSPPIFSFLPINIIAGLNRHYILYFILYSPTPPPTHPKHPILSLYYPEWMVIFPSENSPLLFLFVGLLLFGREGERGGGGGQELYIMSSLYLILCDTV